MTAHRLVVWYNTRCPVCDAGSDWQRNKLLAAVRTGHISFKDINEQPDALASYGASLDDIRRRLHATDENGRLIVGADVAVAMWRVTPGQGWLAALFGNPVMLPVTQFAYDRFADILFAWNKWMRQLVMPTIAYFYGIAIRMYFREHPPPHFFATYSGHEANVSIE